MFNQYPGSPSLRAPNSPKPRPRQTSIVELLSTPPPLEQLNADVTSMDLGPTDSVMPNQPVTASSSMSRSTSVSSAASSVPSLKVSGSGPATEWYNVPLSELVERNKLVFISGDISCEEAFGTLVKNNLTSVPVEGCENDLECLTFDYTDLNSYLLLVLNRLDFEEISNIDYEPRSEVPLLVQKAQRGEQVPTRFVIKLSTKNPFIKLEETDTLASVVGALGSGVHRIAITNNNAITAILSQRRLMKYLWDNGRRFPSLDPLLQSTIASLGIGSTNVVSVFGDQQLIEALMTMHTLRVSSLAVVDKSFNLLGNISVTDVKHVSSTSKSNLLYKSCLHFISVILNTRGLELGKDSFPIFHVTSTSSLGRTIAKMVATQAHRLWVVKPFGSPNAEDAFLSGSHADSPASPTSQPIPPPLTSSSSSSSQHYLNFITEKDTGRPGKLIGVVSLTDILSLFARQLAGRDVDPGSARKQRRRSSSSSTRSVTSRSSAEHFRKSFGGHNSELR